MKGLGVPIHTLSPPVGIEQIDVAFFTHAFI